MRWAVLLLLFWTPALLGQDGEGCGCAPDDADDGCSSIEIGEGPTEDGGYDVAIDPFEEPPIEVEEPNRPEPIKVGEWEPPGLKPEAEQERLALEAGRSAASNDVSVRYKLAQFYLDHGWFPHAEAELFRCGELDRDSVRPWEALIDLYRRCVGEAQQPQDDFGIFLGPGAPRMVTRRVRPNVSQGAWLATDPAAEANRRISRAYRELLARRPDDFARRREFLLHLAGLRDHAGVVEQARALLARMPGDADTRFELAEALRILGARAEAASPGTGKAESDEAVAQLEQVLQANPAHARAALRLVRVLAVRDGAKAADRIHALQKQAFFHLFLRADLASVPYREDIFNMARDLAGPSIARRLWDDAMVPPWARDNPWDRPHYTAWIDMRFARLGSRERAEVIKRLARRGDEGAAAMLVSFLWHLEDWRAYGDTALVERKVAKEAEEEAIRAVCGLGSVAFPASERFLAASRGDLHRQRAVLILSGLHDARATGPLLDALAFDIRKEVSFGVAAALEDLHDPRALDGLVAAALDVRRPVERRREAAEALGAFRDPRSVEALSTLRKDPQFLVVASYGLLRLTGDAEAFAALEQDVKEGADPAGTLRLVAKCDEPRVEVLFLYGLARAPEAQRPEILALLRARFWATAMPKVKEILLKEAESPAVSPFALGVLGEIGGEDVEKRLGQIIEHMEGEMWAAAARAYAETGCAEAVRYFSRMKILSKDAARRRLAEELHLHAAKRQAQRERAASGG